MIQCFCFDFRDGSYGLFGWNTIPASAKEVGEGWMCGRGVGVNGEGMWDVMDVSDEGCGEEAHSKGRGLCNGNRTWKGCMVIVH